MADNEELTVQREQEFAKFIRFSVLLAIVIVGFVA